MPDWLRPDVAATFTAAEDHGLLDDRSGADPSALRIFASEVC